jgi:hypothetical protein
MAKDLADWIVKYPSFAVALALGLVALVLAVLGLVASQWIKPKIGELDKLQGTVSDAKTSLAVTQAQVGELKSQDLLQAIGNLQGRIASLEAAKASEQEILTLKLKTLEDANTEASAKLGALQIRSESEIGRIQAEKENAIRLIEQGSRDELRRLISIEGVRLALEQAGQDLELANIGEMVARMNDARHPDALAKVRMAEARVEALRVQYQSLDVQATVQRNE